MAQDLIARAMAASGGGGGEGSIEDIISGDGISVTGGSTKTISNAGVRSVKASMKDGAISVNTGGTTKDIVIPGLIGKRSSNGGEIFNAASMAVSNAHAEGNATEATAKNSHAEGNTTISSGMNSHTEGDHTEASGLNSHAGGLYTIASGDNQTVIGKYNAADRNKAFIIGGGTSDSNKNIATVDWDGNLVLDGTVTAKDANGNEVVLNGIDAYTKDEVDKKINKTTIETVTSDANVVTVPENVKDFGMVSMIGGKTVKTKNLIKYPWLHSGTAENDDAKMVIYDNGTLDITAKRTTVADFRYTLISSLNGRVKLKPNTTYVANVFNELAEERTAIMILELLPEATSGTRTRAINLTNTFVEFTTTSEELYANVAVKINKGNSAFNTLKLSPVLYEKTEAVDYFEPYFSGLHNAPIGKIVMVGRNRIMNTIKHSSINTNGSLYSSTATTNYDTHIVKVASGQTYSFSKGTDTYVYAFYNSYPNIGDISYDGSRTVGGNGTVTAKIDGYLCFRSMTGFKANCEIGDNVSDIPEPYTETTISLSDFLGLPDYGLSAEDVYNYIDFENMVYHHKARKIDATKLNWQLESGKGYYSNDFKNLNIIKTSGNMISDKYSYSTTVWESNCFGVNSNGTLWTGDTSASPSTFDKFEIVFELATEELIDLKPIFTILPVEANGTIEFVNEHNLPVPSTIKYQKGAE